MCRDVEYMTEQVSNNLAGATIQSACVDMTGEAFGFVIINREGKRQTVWVMCDAEGNGPGWLNIEPLA